MDGVDGCGVQPYLRRKALTPPRPCGETTLSTTRGLFLFTDWAGLVGWMGRGVGEVEREG